MERSRENYKEETKKQKWLKNIFIKLGQTKLVLKCSSSWAGLKKRHPGIAQFLLFFVLSNGVTLLQMILMPAFRALFDSMGLVNIGFQVWHLGYNYDGSMYYIFNYASGAIASGGGGGLAYFLAVQITLLFAQVINFFAQRNITFKSNGDLRRAALWYLIAYIIISIGAAALQGLYKAPIYNLLINTWALGKFGETLADIITIIIYCAISFWVFFPIFKVIFKNKKDKLGEQP